MEEQHHEQGQANDQEPNQDQAQLFQNGFNSGYLIAKFSPELSQKLGAIENNQSDFFIGMVSGKEQYEIETREWAKSFSRNAPEKDKRDLGQER